MHDMAHPSSFITRLIRTLWRLALALTGLAFMAVLLVLGLMVGLGVYLWARLRGRPVVPGRFQWQRTTAGMPGWARGASAPGRPSPAEVVDVEAREVPEPAAAPLPAPRRAD